MEIELHCMDCGWEGMTSETIGIVKYYMDIESCPKCGSIDLVTKSYQDTCLQSR